MSTYLENFPEEYRTWVRSRVASAYVFAYQNYGHDAADLISIAQGPIEMESRFVEHCTDLLEMPLPQDKRTVVEKMLELGIPVEYRMQIKEEVDAAWAKSAQVVSDRFTKQSAKPPSAKQKAYIKSLGCNVVPKTSAEASKLIEEYKFRNR